MPAPAFQRLLELLDKWLSSLDLHLKYSSLDEETYWKIQPWVEHERPARWIIELAAQKTRTLRAEVQRRAEANDEGFAEAMELMAFLANLVGSQHIERFIPLADAANERWVSNQAAVEAAADGTREIRAPADGDLPTREMPALAHAASGARGGAKREGRKGQKAKAVPAEAADEPRAHPMRDQVIEDAVRLMQWGRKWYELAELISRMADRPSLPEVRLILKDEKAAIEKLARG